MVVYSLLGCRRVVKEKEGEEHRGTARQGGSLQPTSANTWSCGMAWIEEDISMVPPTSWRERLKTSPPCFGRASSFFLLSSHHSRHAFSTRPTIAKGLRHDNALNPQHLIHSRVERKYCVVVDRTRPGYNGGELTPRTSASSVTALPHLPTTPPTSSSWHAYFQPRRTHLPSPTTRTPLISPSSFRTPAATPLPHPSPPLPPPFPQYTPPPVPLRVLGLLSGPRPSARPSLPLSHQPSSSTPSPIHPSRLPSFHDTPALSLIVAYPSRDSPFATSATLSTFLFGFPIHLPVRTWDIYFHRTQLSYRSQLAADSPSAPQAFAHPSVAAIQQVGLIDQPVSPVCSPPPAHLTHHWRPASRFWGSASHYTCRRQRPPLLEGLYSGSTPCPSPNATACADSPPATTHGAMQPRRLAPFPSLF